MFERTFTGKGALWFGDCLNALPHVANNSVDMVLADLPYQATYNAWDTAIDLTLLWEQLHRVTKKNGAMCVFAAHPFTAALGASNIRHLRYAWVWHKNQPTGHLNAKKRPLMSHEDILVFYRKAPVYHPQGTRACDKRVVRAASPNYRPYGSVSRQTVENYPRSVLAFPRQSHTQHPTQKPVELCEYLIRTYTNEGDTVLDPCAGSGTTCVAAVNTKRLFVGMELDRAYFDLSTRRIVNA